MWLTSVEIPSTTWAPPGIISQHRAGLAIYPRLNITGVAHPSYLAHHEPPPKKVFPGVGGLAGSIRVHTLHVGDRGSVPEHHQRN